MSSFSLFSFLFEDTSCFEIIKTLYGLTQSELEILTCVHNIKESDIKAIQKIIPKDHSTISRALQKLISTGLVKKQKVILHQGGYKYRYTPLSIEEMKNKFLASLEEIMQRMKEAVQTLSEEKCKEFFQEVIKKYQT